MDCFCILLTSLSLFYRHGLGALLSQVVKGEGHPVLYIIRKLLVRETKYSNSEGVPRHQVGGLHPQVLPVGMGL